ncbi:uncharacterized protein LOC135385276 isoform X2 [Ornithodoros turicata]|uniref:uncharacterized protein LOC135385276 isoform X2 n=1 Tax=Ornithodoros turicata TaxID=34597 RepID=UPI0031399BE7
MCPKDPLLKRLSRHSLKQSHCGHVHPKKPVGDATSGLWLSVAGRCKHKKKRLKVDTMQYSSAAFDFTTRTMEGTQNLRGIVFS